MFSYSMMTLITAEAPISTKPSLTPLSTVLRTGCAVLAIFFRKADENSKTSNFPTLRVPLVIFTLSALGLVAQRNAGSAEFIFLEGTSSVSEVSDDGRTVVGRGPDSAFVWNADSGFTFIDGFSASAVSSNGEFVTGWDNPDVWRWSRNTGKQVIFSGSGSSSRGISADGSTIVGREPGGPWMWTESEGVRSLIGLGLGGSISSRPNDISPDGKTVVGNFTNGPANEAQAFLWSEELGRTDLGTLPGDNFSAAQKISHDLATVVGWSCIAGTNVCEAFRWTDDQGIEGIGVLPGDTSSQARSTNVDGSMIVGESFLIRPNEHVNHSFIWRADTGILDLKQWLIDEHDLGDPLNGFTLVKANDISPDGSVITGDGRNAMGDRGAWVVYLDKAPNGQPGDFDGNGLFDALDVDSLVNSIVGGLNEQAFDLSGDGLVDLDDLTIWLDDAAKQNGFAESYLLGDANLDGTINPTDLNKLGLHWKQNMGRWSAGDFNADGTIDAADLNSLGQNWLQSIAMTSPTAVPEPMSHFLFGLGAIFMGLSWRAKSIPRFVE